MPRRRQPPRLYLKAAYGGRRSVWVIRDGQATISTGHGPDEHAAALVELKSYAKRRYGDESILRARNLEPYPVVATAIGWIYFISARLFDDYPIKIGFTADATPDRRLECLQAGSPVTLKVLAVMRGTISMERALHKQFQGASIGREWFERTPDLMQMISDLRSAIGDRLDNTFPREQA